MKSSFFLVIPNQYQNQERLKSFKESSLDQWLEALPSANYGLSVQLVYDLLVEFNKIEMDACFRLDALEVLRPSFLGIQEYLRSRLTASGFPKSEDHKKIFKVLISVQREFAISYWIAAKERTKKNIGWLKGKEITLAVQRVMRCLSEIIVSCYLLKVPVPGWVWIDVHSLFRLSETISKSTVKVSDQSCVFNKTTSIEDTYKQILLLSLAQPNGLRQKEVIQTYRFCEHFASILLINKEVVPGQRCQNIIITDGDRAPFQVNSAAYTAIDSAIIFLKFTKVALQLDKKKTVAKHLTARFSAINLDINVIDKLPLELIEYIELNWAGFTLNKTTPFSDRLDRNFAIGLAPTYELMTTLALDLNADTEMEYFAETSSDKSLILKSKVDDVLSVGSLISLRKPNEPHKKRAIGVISSISLASLESNADFEVKLLGEKIRAATISFTPDGKASEDTSVLFYITQNGQDKRSYLITESFMLKNDDIVKLCIDDREFPVVLRKRNTIGLGYWQFECRRIKQQEQETNIKKGYKFI